MMKLGWIMAAAIALALGSFAVAQTGKPRAAAHFHVDYERGNDQNDGLSPQRSWKHAPGDPSATDRPKGLRLVPGDKITFAAGVTYRGTIVVSDSGTQTAPIVFEGAAGPPAIINGSEPVEATPCGSQPECQGLTGKAVLLRIDRHAALAGTIFDSAGAMRLAQDPNPESAQYPDEITQFRSIATSRIQAGELPLPIRSPDCASDCGMELALWVQRNVVVSRPVLSIKDGKARFDPQELRFYTDRDTRYALRGLPQFLDEPGEYLPIGDGLVLALPRQPGSKFALASGRGGISVRNASWLTIRNLGFEQMGDGGGFGKGIGVFVNTPGIRGLTISNNHFRHFDLRSGTGAINLRGVSDLTVKGNRIEGIVRGSGIRLAGPSLNTRIAANNIVGIGRTAIYIAEAKDVEVTDNFIADVKGVHGNGLTAYQGNNKVAFRRNTVIDAKQAVTFQGNNGKTAVPQSLIFENNLLVSTPDALGALISWGLMTRDVAIRDNILLGGAIGLRMNASDQGVAVSGNFGMPPAATAPVAEPTGAQANRWLSAAPPWQQELLQHVRTRTPVPAELQRRVCKAAFGSASTGRAVGADFVCP